VTKTRKGEEDQIKQNDLEWQIYDLLGSGCLTPDIVDYLREMLATNNEWQPLRLFERLNQFWEEWCEGKFIDRTEDNLPQKKMKNLKEQIPARETLLGIRQVDVYTGLNILILLLELYRYAQGKDKLKNSIVFHPSGEPSADGYTNRLLKILHYSESIEIGTFNQNLRFFLSDANLSRAYLIGADLSGAYLIGANLSGANLFGAYLSGANLSRAHLSGAYLRRAYFRDANLSDANLSDANLGGADLSDANLSGTNFRDANLSDANLSDANFSGTNLSNVRWDKVTNWRDSFRLATAINIPIELKRYLRLH
jgi:Pentapeptide repeats (8 copies)